MMVCDRHPERRAAYSICLGVQEQFDICNVCADEIKNWVATPEKVLYPITQTATEPGKSEGNGQKEEVLTKRPRKRG